MYIFGYKCPILTTLVENNKKQRTTMLDTTAASTEL
jgi:hypothetical protein